MSKELSFRQKMNRIYKDICGYEIDKIDEKKVRVSKGSPVYGEITFTSVDRLLDYLKIKEKDVLYDLGSGVGKVILQAAIKTKVQKAIGVELSKERYLGAKKALKNAGQWFNHLDGRVSFINDSLLNVDFKKASIIYTCSTAFSEAFMKNINHHLGQYQHPFRLVSLQELPNNKFFEPLDVLKLDMSWIKQTSVHIYRRRISS